MLIQSSLLNSVSTALSLASDLGKQDNMELLCDWSQFGENWQKFANCDTCPWDSCRKAISTGEEKSNLFCTGNAELSKTCSDLSVVIDMCASSAPKRDGYVYKRRRLRRNTVALLSEENATETTKGSAGCHSNISSAVHPLTVQKDDLHRAPVFTVCGSSRDSLDHGNSLISGQHHIQYPTTIPSSQIIEATNSESLPKSLLNNRCFVREVTLPAEASISTHCKSALVHHSCINDSCSSSKSNTRHGSAVMKTEMDTRKYSLSDVIVAEPLEEFTSARELCISVLKRHGLLVGVGTSSACASSEVLGVDDANFSQSCKLCGRLENPLKMLICDLCEEAFHVSCCNPKVKKLPDDEWYCQPCFRKKSKALPKRSSGKSFNIMYENRNRKSHGKVGPILLMLRDNQPCTSGVRIGKDFQAEVPEWAGPISDDYDYFGEPSEMDPAECSSLDSSTPSSIGNWIQCREVMYKNINDEGTVCGKCSRALLFVVQSDDWDCSCSVLWDPIHADCAVPQELETDVILKHLTYIEMVCPSILF